MTGDEFERFKIFVDEKFRSHEQLISSRFDVIDKLVNDHHVSLYGNGSDGLKLKVDRIETAHKTLNKAWVFITAGVITVATWLGVNK